MAKGVFRRIGMTAIPAGNTGRDALLSVPDGARFAAEVGPDVRSRRSHNHQFAEVAEYWQHLPEHISDELPTPTHLRKYALCVAGFCEIEKIVLSTPQEALQVAAFARPKSQNGENYVVIDVAERVVTRRTPHSQSLAKMGARDFQASKDAVLEVCARLVGSTLEQLRPSPPIAPESEDVEETERVTS